MTRRLMLVATSYPADAADWRGVFIRHLAFALAARPDIDLGIWAPPGELPPRARSLVDVPTSAWLGALSRSGGIAHVMRGGGLRGLAAPLRLLLALHRAYRHAEPPDAYFVNWLQCALPLPRNGRPLLLTALGDDLRLLDLPLVKPLLRRAMRGRAVVVCPNAAWMEAPLRAAFGDVATVEAIPFGIDDRWFAIEHGPRAVPHRWLAVTRLTRAKIGDLFDWGETLFGDGRRELHLIGPMQETMTLPDWVTWHGPASAEALATRWFPGATGLVTLSRHAEGRPQVVLEAMAAGLPVVASTNAAHGDIVIDGVTGRLCADPAAFAEALAAFEREGAAAAAGQAARARVHALCGTWRDCTDRYLAALDRAIAARGQPR